MPFPTATTRRATRRDRPLAVTLLPGSRALTAESFALQVDALRSLPADMRPDIFLAVAGSVSVDELGEPYQAQRTPMLSAEPSDLGELSDGDLTIHMAAGQRDGQHCWPCGPSTVTGRNGNGAGAWSWASQLSPSSMPATAAPASPMSRCCLAKPARW